MRFYAVAVYDERGCMEIKAYCLTKALAKEELKKYADEWYSTPPKPDARHIIEYEMITGKKRPRRKEKSQ